MKSHVANSANAVYCIRVMPVGFSDLTTSKVFPIYITSHPHDLRMSNGKVYQAETGYEFTGLESENDFSPSTIDLEGILKEGAITREQLRSGVYDNARVYLFKTSWSAPVEDEEEMGLLFWGKVQIIDGRYKVELMAAIDVLQQNTSRSYSPTCPWTFADMTVDGHMIPAGRSRCSGPRSAPDGPDGTSLITVQTVISDIPPQNPTQLRFYTIMSPEVPDDYYGNGQLQFLTGANANLDPSHIKISEASGGYYMIFEVYEPLLYPVQVGDTFRVIPGCRKRKEDCVIKWGNMVNNGSFPDVPAPTQYAQVGRKQ